MAKQINDPIHGQIPIDTDALLIIEHKSFQRLRRIKALGFLDRVFPSAKHSRFEHSIGAYHVVRVLIDSIRKVSEDLGKGSWLQSSDFIGLQETDIKKVFSDELKNCVGYAALLHDIGHGPFSHASETIMCEMDSLISENTERNDFIIKALKESKNKKIKKGKIGKNLTADHEDYSLLALDFILTDLNFDKIKIQLIASLKSELVEPPIGYDKRIIRLLGQLVDGEIDSDRMDYLLRDSHFCGVPFGKYDLKRLCDGLCVLKDNSEGFSFGILRKAQTAFEDFLFSRFQMHIQIYTHKIDASCNKSFEIMAKASGYCLPAEVSKYLEIDDENILYSTDKLSNLIPMIRDRKLWPLAIQSYSNDKSNENVLFEKIKNSLGDSNVAIYKSERPFKKATLLDFPVVNKSLSGELMSDKMRTSSELIAHYNAVFNVKRLFYHPAYKEQVKVVIESITKTLSFEKSTMEHHTKNAESVANSSLVILTTKVDDKK